jgi:hypothetical protein
MTIDLRLHDVQGSCVLVEWIYGGTSEIMKTIIAREVTGLRA